MANGTDRTDELLALMRERILVLDGAMGTMLQGRDLGPEDFGGDELEGCNENWCVTRPDVMLDIHRAYLEAGADIVETEHLRRHAARAGGVRPRRARAESSTGVAAALARQAAAEFAHGRPPALRRRLDGAHHQGHHASPAGSPSRSWSDTSREQALGLIEGGVDLLLVETCQDTRNVKAALIGDREAVSQRGRRRPPLMVSGTIEPTGTMLAGQTAEAFVASLEHLDLLAIGLNCATGPEFMTDHLRALPRCAACAVSCYAERGAARRGRALPGDPGRAWPRVLERFVERAG